MTAPERINIGMLDQETGISAVVLTSRNCPHKEGLAYRSRIINKLIGG